MDMITKEVRQKAIENIRKNRKSGVKMHDLGHKFVGMCLEKSTNTKEKIYYPSFSVTEKELPGISKYGMDKTITLKVIVKVKGINQQDDNPKSYNLDIQKAGFI